jgi:hypothetical protein
MIVIMATNNPTGDNARKGAVRKRSQLKAEGGGRGPLDQAGQGNRRVHGPAAGKFKGVRRES